MSILDVYRLKKQLEQQRMERIAQHGQQAQRSFEQAATIPLQADQYGQDQRRRDAELKALTERMRAQGMGSLMTGQGAMMRGQAAQTRADSDRQFKNRRIDQFGQQIEIDRSKAGETERHHRATEKTAKVKADAVTRKAKVDEQARQLEQLAARMGVLRASSQENTPEALQIAAAIDGLDAIPAGVRTAAIGNDMQARIDRMKKEREDALRWNKEFKARKEERELKREENATQRAIANEQRERGLAMQRESLNRQNAADKRIPAPALKAIETSDQLIRNGVEMEKLLAEGAETGWMEDWQSRFAKYFGFALNELDEKLRIRLATFTAPIRNDTYGAALSAGDRILAQENLPHPDDSTAKTAEKLKIHMDIARRTRENAIRMQEAQGRDVSFLKGAGQPGTLKDQIGSLSPEQKTALMQKVKALMSQGLSKEAATTQALGEM